MNPSISVVVSDSKLSGKLTFRYISYGGFMPGKPGQLSRLKNAIFFDVFVDGLSGGDAWVSITHDSIGKDHKISYFNGQEWVPAHDQLVDVVGHTIKGKFSVADLGKTPISIGT